ncbi:MAG: nuclear transport factor 2 family protein [Steroidobacteraceae bacterium]
MHVSRPTILALGAVALLAACGGKAPPPAASTPHAAPCDRTCLEGLVDGYVDALLAHDPAMIPAAPGVRFVENGVELPLGSALWRTASGRGGYRHYFADVAGGQAGFIGTLREHDKGIIFVLRLGVQDRRIREIEQLAIRTGNVEEYEKLKPDPLWTEAVPEAARIPRAELAALADRYYTGMQRNDPKGDYSFFHKDCNRVEHGRQTTNMPPSNYGHSDIANFVTMGCEAQFQTGFLGFVTRIRDRRYAVIDEERQAVLAFAYFDHDGSIRSIPLSTGQTFKVPPYFSSPRTLPIAEAFRIADHKLRLVEATLTESPYGMQSAYDARPAAPARVAAVDPCDATCTRTLIDGLLDAMIAHDPAKAPLAPGARYTENGQPLSLGDGLWRTLTARGSYSVYLAAEAGGDPALFGSIVETDIPGMLSLRIRQQAGKITEIEALAVRQEIPMLGKLIGTGTLMAPPQLADLDAKQFRRPLPVLVAPVPPAGRQLSAKLREAAWGFEPALYGEALALPLADRCTARENGVPAVDNARIAPLPGTQPPFHPFRLGCRALIASGFYAQVGKLREQRVLAIDASQGLVLLADTIDHRGDVATVKLKGGGDFPVPEAFRPPNSYLRSLLIKVRDGRIEHVETLTRPVFYGMDDGWGG